MTSPPAPESFSPAPESPRAASPSGGPDAAGSRVRLSVVVTIVDGAAAVEECLEALTTQHDAPSMEIIVPHDDSVEGMDAVVDRFPSVRFLSIGRIDTERPLRSPSGQHELYDRRRAAGLAVADGEVVCIVEDRGVPEAGWAAKIDRAQRDMPHAVIGGAVDCDVTAALNLALFFCDYGRYQRPFDAGPREYVTDVNISYRRDALDSTRELWRDRYHETTVHWELARRGETLWLSPDFVVWQRRRGLRLRSILRERFEWGRLFAYTRAREAGGAKRLAYAVLSPLLPLILFARHTRLQMGKRSKFGGFVRVSPLVALFLVVWSLGETVGYVTGRP